MEVEDEDWVKPSKVCCTTQWNRGITMTVNSKDNVSVDGMPWYILDVCRIVTLLDDDCGEEEGNGVSNLRSQQAMQGVVDFDMQ